LSSVEEPRGDYDDAVLGGRPIRHEFTYDLLGSLVKEVHAANTAMPRMYTYKRDAEGSPLEVLDPLGRRLVRIFDERGLLLSEEFFDPSGTRARQRSFAYTRNGEIASASVNETATVEFGYDGFRQLRRVTSPDGSTIEYRKD